MSDRFASHDRSRMTLLCITCVLVAVLFVMLARPVFEGGVYTRDDLANHALPIRHFYAEALKNGDSFLWWPGIMNGTYIHGEGQAGMCHPVHMLLYRWLPLDVAFNGEFLFNYLWLFVGAYFMMRRVAMVPAHAALLGAMVFTFSGFSLQRFVHINAVAVVSHIPWLLWADHLVMTGRARGAGLLGAGGKNKKTWLLAWAPAVVALLTGSQLLMGYPQYVWYSLIAEMVFVLACIRRWGSWGRLPLLAGAKLVGLMIGMVQLLPSADALAHSVRGDTSMEFRTTFSLHPMNLLQLWSPSLFRAQMYAESPEMGNSYEMRLYAGALCTVAVAWLFVRWRSLRRWRAIVVTAMVFAVAMLWMATGGYGQIYKVVASLPVVGAFRCPTRQIVLVHLALALVAAIAFADLSRLARRGREVAILKLWPMAVPLLLSVLTAGAAMWLLRTNGDAWREDLTSTKIALFGAIGIVGATAIFVMTARGFSALIYAMPLLIAYEAVTGGLMGQVWLAMPGQQPFKSVESIAMSVPRPMGMVQGRVYMPELERNILTLSGYRVSNGYLGLEPMKTLQGHTLPAMRLSAVETARNSGYWAKIDNPLPRVRLMSRAIRREQVEAAIILNDPAMVAVVDRDVTVQEGTPGTAVIVSDRPGVIDIKMQAEGARLLVLSESFDNGWRVTVDGQAVPVVRAYGDFMACEVAGGTHTVSWQFEPASFAKGFRVTLAGLAVVLIWVVGAGVISRR